MSDCLDYEEQGSTTATVRGVERILVMAITTLNPVTFPGRSLALYGVSP